MAQAVERSALVLVGMTQKYFESYNGRTGKLAVNLMLSTGNTHRFRATLYRYSPIELDLLPN